MHQLATWLLNHSEFQLHDQHNTLCADMQATN